MTSTLYQGPNVQNETFIAEPGIYKVECWGAKGYGTYGGCGAYVAGTIKIERRMELYIYVGGIGQKNYNGHAFNGGGKSQVGGGGGSDVRLISGEWNDFNSLKSRIIVAGGGGGYDTGAFVDKAGAGGEIEGLPSDKGYGMGGTQTKGGDGGGSGEFGCGGSNDRLDNEGTNDGNGAGGGGYFGGGASKDSIYYSGGGGSSFISGHKNCNAISNSSSSVRNMIPTNQSIHYSGLKFYNTIMLSGNKPMISPTGTEVTGNCDYGAVKITTISIIYQNPTCKQGIIIIERKSFLFMIICCLFKK